MRQNLPLVLEQPFTPPQKWILAAQILAFNGWKRGFTKNGAFKFAAQHVGVHVSTLNLWAQDPRFIDLVEQQNAQIVTAAVHGLTSMFKNNVAACHCVLQNIQPKRWDPRIRLEKLKHRLQSKLQKEMRLEIEDKIGPCPVPVYVSASSMPDPDNGVRPVGYEEFTKNE